MDRESRVGFLIDNLDQAKLDRAVDEYLCCEDADDFSKYASGWGFTTPKGYYLYSSDWLNKFWIRKLMAIAYFQEFDEILDRSALVDGANTNRFRDLLVDRFSFYCRSVDDESAELDWQANESTRLQLKTNRVLELEDDEIHVEEGAARAVNHKVRERDPKIVKAKKYLVLTETGKLACEVCSFDFRSTYGEHGDGFAECHHVIPLSKPDRGPITSLADLAIVCANCHRMLHRGKRWPSLSDLKNLITQNSDQS